MRPLGNDTITVQRAALLTDPRDGSKYRDWDNAVETVVGNCNVQPFPLAEKLNLEENRDREFARTAIRIFAPPGTRFEVTDRIVFEDNIYDVFGHHGTWRRFSGLERYVQVIARVREG
jgi:hypothetical protein